MKVSIKNITKKQLITGIAITAGLFAVLGLAILLSMFFKDKVAITVGETKIYLRDYNRIVKDAESVGINKKDITSTIIDYYQTKEAANKVGLAVNGNYIKLAVKNLQESNKKLPDSIANMQAYGTALNNLIIYGRYSGVNGKIVWVPYTSTEVDNMALFDKGKAKQLIDRAHSELEKGSNKGIDDLRAADINKTPYGEYLFTDDGEFIMENGKEAFKQMPVERSVMSEYVKKCTKEGVCPVSEDKDRATYFFVQNYFRVNKIDMNLADKLELEKQKIKVVDYVN